MNSRRRGAGWWSDDEEYPGAGHSRYEGSQFYSDARKASRIPVIITVVSVAIVAVGALLMVGGSGLINLPSIQLSSGSSTSDNSNTQATDNATAQDDQSGPVTINLTMAGDVYLRYQALLSGQTSGGGYSYTHLFSHVKDELSDADLALVNQEGVLAGTDLGYIGTRNQVNSPDELGDAEASAGFDVIVAGNDHAFDEGYEGLHNELAFWDGVSGVNVVGVSDPQSSTTSPTFSYTYEKDGFKVAVLSYTDSVLSPVNTTTDGNYVSLYDEDTMKSDVSAAKADGADMVVVCMHWGDDYSQTVSDTQRTEAQALADAGVDVILGTHPHVLQPEETLTGDGGHQTVCYWSLGSLINSGMSGAGYVGGIAKLQLQKNSDGTCSVQSASLVPVVIHVGSTTDTMSVYPVSDYTNDLAQTNDDTSITPDYVESLLDSLYGDAYDASKGTVTF